VDGFLQVVLVHLHADEVETELGRRDRRRPQTEERIEHDTGA
jgi:hypothetical protein